MDQQHEQPQIPQTPKSSGTGIYMIGGIILICAGIGVYLFTSNAPTQAQEQAQPTQTQPIARNYGGDDDTEGQVPAQTPAKTFSAYKDGTFSADGAYTTHVGPEQVHVSLTLKGGVITDSQFSATPNAERSGYYQGMFADNYKQYVIGKNINDVHLTKVSGSSLTPIGFNDALEKIKAQAAVSS